MGKSGSPPHCIGLTGAWLSLYSSTLKAPFHRALLTFCAYQELWMIYILYIYSLRLQNMFQQLERVGGKAAKNQAGEELQQMRYATCKIYQILCTQGKI